jgi:hypothetical protein
MFNTRVRWAGAAKGLVINGEDRREVTKWSWLQVRRLLEFRLGRGCLLGRGLIMPEPDADASEFDHCGIS